MNGPVSTGLLRLATPLIVLVWLSSCSGVEIIGKNETNVWIRNPMLSLGDSDDLANEHCAFYGKVAELESDLSVAENSRSILVYACK